MTTTDWVLRACPEPGYLLLIAGTMHALGRVASVEVPVQSIRCLSVELCVCAVLGQGAGSSTRIHEGLVVRQLHPGLLVGVRCRLVWQVGRLWIDREM